MELGMRIPSSRPFTRAKEVLKDKHKFSNHNKGLSSEGIRIRNILLVAILICHTFIFFRVVHADTPNLTDIFYTKAFQGSWEVITKYNFLGMCMNWLISSFCVIGLFLQCFSKVVTLLYLSGKPFWDNVHAIKSDCKGDNAFGLKNHGQKTLQGNYGTGGDAILGFLCYFLFDIKRWSDYNPDSMLDGLSDEDNSLTYMLKIAPSTILSIFFFAIGFSGTLMKMYGTVVNGMTAFADRAVMLNFEVYVDRFLNRGHDHVFTLGADSTASGKAKENIARDIYTSVLKTTGANSEGARSTIGSNVEGLVRSEMTAGEIGTRLGLGRELNDTDWKNLRAEIIVSTADTAGTASFTYPVKQFVPAYEGGHYVHVIFKLKTGGGDYMTPQVPES